MSNITQSLRNDSEIFTLKTLFSNLLDESKRQDNKDSYNQALFTYNKDNRKYKGKKHPTFFGFFDPPAITQTTITN